jgi:flagellar biosynthesis chaperone FliJ
VLDKLRDRQAADHRKQQERQATKQFDELAAVGYFRRQEAPA